MLTWKVILEAVCVVIAAVLIFLFAVPYLMEVTGTFLPHIFFEWEEDIRCHLFQRLGICLSLYPNPVKDGEKVEVTFRSRRWYEGDQACVADTTNKAIGCCTLKKGKCNTEFTAVSPGGTYFAFININPIEMPLMWNEGQDPKGEEKKLEVHTAS